MTKGVYERPARSCEEVGCEAKHLAKGKCSYHYHRSRNGTDTREKVDSDFRECTKCGEVKASESYRVLARGQHGRSRQCKKCDQAQSKEWASRPENRDRAARKAKRSKAVRTYGARGGEAWDRIQEGSPCEACGVRREYMHLDHNHSTGEFRGILCSQCNTALGLLGEDLERFSGLMAYMITHDFAKLETIYSQLDAEDLQLLKLMEGEA